MLTALSRIPTASALSRTTGGMCGVSLTKTVLLLNHYERLGPRVALEVDALRQAGYAVRVIHWAAAPVESASPRAGAVTEEHLSYPRPRGTLNVLRALPSYYRRLTRHVAAGGFAFVHCTHFMLLPLALHLARRHRAKAIYDVYEFHLHDIAEGLPRWLRWLVPLLRSVERFCVRRVNGILTVDSADHWLEQRYAELNPNVRVLFNVPDIDRPMPKVPEALERKYAGRRVVTYVGGMSEQKGALRAVEATARIAAAVPESICLFIGVFHGTTETRFWELVSEAGLSDHVEHIPWLAYDVMLEHLELADVGLALHQSARRYMLVGKGNGRKMFTYMQVGLPIVGPDFGALGDLIRDEDVGIAVDTGDPAAIADAVARILRDDPLAARYAENGRRAIAERYNWSLERGKLLELYSALEEA